jgi:hypothetical protein
MARMRFRRSYNFDSATRQLDSRDLDEAGDPTTDMGAAMESLLGQYGALDLQPAYPGLDILEGSIATPAVSGTAFTDFGALAAAMDRAGGYEDFPATLPQLGTFSDAVVGRVIWTPNAPGIYQWYSMQYVNLDMAADPTTQIDFRPPLPDILDFTWGGDPQSVNPTGLAGDLFLASHSGMLMASQEMLDAGFGGLSVLGPYLNLQGGETVDLLNLMLAVISWSPAGTVPYLGGIL